MSHTSYPCNSQIQTHYPFTSLGTALSITIRSQDVKLIFNPLFELLTLYYEKHQANTPHSGQFQGSHAFTRILAKTKSVNPNNGSLNVIVSHVRMRDIRPSIDNLNLFYSAGFRGTFGRPKNSGLDSPCVWNGQSVSFDRRNYAIDLDWVESKSQR